MADDQIRVGDSVTVRRGTFFKPQPGVVEQVMDDRIRVKTDSGFVLTDVRNVKRA